MAQPADKPLSVDTRVGEILNLGSRFSNVQVIGYGSSGVVMAADDKRTKRRVAVKRMSFSELRSAKRALREIRLMKRLSHDNVVSIEEILGANCGPLSTQRQTTTTSPTTDLKQICIVEELMDADLHQLIRADLLTPSYARLFLYQILRGLKYIHSANVIHRDLKPSNILINCQQLTLKISDFGLCRVLDPAYDHSGYLTERVGTCWYVSPEQVLSPRDYDSKVDMWSAGCVFAEMLLGRPVFTGANELSQMLLVLDSIHLTEEDWGRVLRVMPNKLLKNHPFRPRTPLADKFTDIPPQALDLLERLLTFDPAQRVTAEQALQHAYLAEYRHTAQPNARTPLRVEYEAEPSSPRSVERLLVEEANTTPHVTCGHVNHPAADDVTTPVSSSSNVTSSTSISQGSNVSTISSVIVTSADSCVTSSSSVRSSRSMMTSMSSSVTSQNEDVQHETHTLDEILQLDHSDTVDGIGDGGWSSGSSSVEDLNMRNLRQSQENLHSCLLSPHNIHNMSVEERAPEQDPDTQGSGSPEGVPKQKLYHDDDEKDVAEPSLQKIVEDEELAGNVDTGSRGEILASTDTGADNQPSCEPPQTEVEKQSQLFVHIDKDTSENFKEFSQISPKNQGSDHVASVTPPRPGSATHASGARSRLGNPRPLNSDYDEDFAKEKKLLDYENERYSKFHADAQENEKNQKRRSSCHGTNPDSDLDEMYRLPTEHLRIDRDYSNERIKHKRLTKVQRQYLALYRDGINELNERLKEATLDGAVGGSEDFNAQHENTHSHNTHLHNAHLHNAHLHNTHQSHGQEYNRNNHITVSNISIAPSVRNNQSPSGPDLDPPGSNLIRTINQQRDVDLRNNQRVAVATSIERQRQRRNGDGLSSPEENPSSPRASFSSGARPKKSPRKQKAL